MGRPAVTRNAGADRAVAVINQLTHTKGPFALQPFNLRRWQERDIVRPLFTTKPDGLRQYRTCLLMMPRKNGKIGTVRRVRGARADLRRGTWRGSLFAARPIPIKPRLSLTSPSR